MDVSIIIPFFNSGDFIDEAVCSAEKAAEDFKAEIIIVDDGSTEKNSLDQLIKIEKGRKHKVIRRANGGPGAARNTGVKESTGKYLLFLDSDNKLRPEFIKSCLPSLQCDTKTGVVYGNTDFFGETTTRKSFKSRRFNSYEILVDNYIDVCSLVRRRAFEEVGGFDEERRIIGYEDWDLWIRLSGTSWKFVYLPQTLFDYRLRKESVITLASSDENYHNVQQYVMGKNAVLFHKRFVELYHQAVFYQRDKQQPLRSYIKFLRDKYITNSRKRDNTV
jgi:glycosyltransferase involved in cell wall biosynthesis